MAGADAAHAGGAGITLEQFEYLCKSRRAMRHFDGRPLPEGVLERLLDCARWAPSGYNLQPTHFIVATESELRKRLRAACMDQKQVEEAPAVVVFAGDRRVDASNLGLMLDTEQKAGTMTSEYRSKIEKIVPLAFGTGPAGVGWLWKSLLLPFVRLFRPVPVLPAVERRYWLGKQTLLAAMNFMLAAEAAGLATVPMEGFDEGRVAKALGLPRHMVPTVVVPVGYAADTGLRKTRLPLARMVHWNGW